MLSFQLRYLTAQDNLKEELVSHPNVLILIDTARIGGPGKGVLQLLRHIAPDNATLTVGTFQSSRHDGAEFIERLRDQNHDPAVFTERFRYDLSVLKQIGKTVMDRNITVIQSHGYKGHLYALLISRLHHIPWVGVMNGWTDENWKVKLYHSLDSFCLRFASSIVAVSTDLYSMARSFAPHIPIHIITNAIDEDDLRGESGGRALRQLLGNEDLVIGSFGRLSPEKGQMLLVQAFAEAIPYLPSSRLLLVGDGTQKDALIKLSCDLGVQDKITFCGYQSVMKDYFEAIDLLVLPSYREGLPNVVLEAMMNRVPVLSSDIPAVEQLIEDGTTGWLFRSGDNVELKDQLIRIAHISEHERANVAASAREQLIPRYCPVRRAEQFLEIYRQVHMKLNRQTHSPFIDSPVRG